MRDASLPEGEEQPPPGTRTAAIVRWSLVGLMALAAGGAWIRHATGGGSGESAQARFHCPMHPSVVQQRRGECPICGMDLVPASAAEASAPPSAAGARQYTCPMHLAFVTDDPNARCPDCGMKLVARSADVGPAAAPGRGARAGGALRGPGPAHGDEDGGRHPRAAPRLDPDDRVRRAHRAGGRGGDRALHRVDRVRPGGRDGAARREGRGPRDRLQPGDPGRAQSVSATVRWSGRGAAGVQPAAPVLASDAARDASQRVELLGVAREDVDAIAASGELPRTVAIRSPVRGHVARKAALRGAYVSPAPSSSRSPTSPRSGCSPTCTRRTSGACRSGSARPSSSPRGRASASPAR